MVIQDQGIRGIQDRAIPVTTGAARK